VDCPLHGYINHCILVTQQAKHLAEVQEFRDAQEATAKDLDDLTNVFTRLGVPSIT
jgi:hypothetical protein